MLQHMRISLLLLCSVFTGYTSISQGLSNDSLMDVQQKEMIAFYDSYTGSNAPLYNGRGYIYYTFKMEGSPFFYNDELAKGWISYAGKKYDPVSLMYDVTRSEVIVLMPDSNSRAVLHNEFIDSFHVAGHTFISLKEDHDQNLYNTAFYDLLHDGRVQLLARRTKLMQEVIRENPVYTIIYPRDYFYIHKNGLYYLVSNKKDVLRVLSDKKSEIKKMMRRRHIKLNRKNFESTLIPVVTFYDKGTN